MKKIACFVLLIPTLASSDQPAVIQSLTDEPANMLDIAMLRLQDFIIWTKPNMAGTYRIESQSEVRRIDINALYVPDKRQISVEATIFDSKSSPEQMEAGCSSVLASMKINLLKSLPGLFIHVDGSYPPNLKEMKFNLAELIELSCVVWGSSSTEVGYRANVPLALRKRAE